MEQNLPEIHFISMISESKCKAYIWSCTSNKGLVAVYDPSYRKRTSNNKYYFG